MFNKIRRLILLAALVMSLSSCGNSNGNVTKVKNPEKYNIIIENLEVDITDLDGKSYKYDNGITNAGRYYIHYKFDCRYGNSEIADQKYCIGYVLSAYGENLKIEQANTAYYSTDYVNCMSINNLFYYGDKAKEVQAVDITFVLQKNDSEFYSISDNSFFYSERFNLFNRTKLSFIADREEKINKQNEFIHKGHVEATDSTRCTLCGSVCKTYMWDYDYKDHYSYYFQEDNCIYRYNNSEKTTKTLLKCLDPSITSFEVPEDVTIIGNNAFQNCKYLEEVGLPEGLIEIGSGAFAFCESLYFINLPDGIKAIGDGAFTSCYNLSIDSLPNSLEYLGSCAFFECSSIYEITIPSKLTSIESSTFCSCNGLVSVSIPEGIKKIGYRAFSNCPSLRYIELNEGLVSIGDSAFEDCKSLEDFTFPNSIVNIGRFAFEDCRSLNELILPKNLANIKTATFRYCSNLRYITFGSNIQFIDTEAFMDTGIRVVYYNSTEANWNRNVYITDYLNDDLLNARIVCE